MIEVFGCEARHFTVKESKRIGTKRDGKFDSRARQCIWVGQSRKILGGHRVIPVTWNPDTAEWELGRMEDVKKVITRSDVFPLRTRQQQGSSHLDFEKFVDSMSPQAVPRQVYEAQSMLDHRKVGVDTEYKIQ